MRAPERRCRRKTCPGKRDTKHARRRHHADQKILDAFQRAAEAAAAKRLHKVGRLLHEHLDRRRAGADRRRRIAQRRTERRRRHEARPCNGDGLKFAADDLRAKRELVRETRRKVEILARPYADRVEAKPKRIEHQAEEDLAAAHASPPPSSEAVDAAQMTADQREGELKAIHIGNFDGLGGASVAALNSTALVDRRRGDADRLRAIDVDMLTTPFVSATNCLAEMSRQTNLMRQTFGKSSEEIAAANEIEKLRTSYLRAGIDETNLSGDALKKFNEYLAETGRRSLQAYRDKSAEDGREQRVTGMYDLTRSSAGDLMSSPLKAMMRGQNTGDAMREAALRMTDRIADMGMNSIMNSLFGKQGQMGGLFGGGLKDLSAASGPSLAAASCRRLAPSRCANTRAAASPIPRRWRSLAKAR